MKKFSLILFLSSTFVILSVLRSSASSLEADHVISPEVTASLLGSSADSDAGLEAQIAEFLKQDTHQRMSSLSYSPILSRIASARAYDMGQRNYYDHKDPDGFYYYDLLKKVGYESNGGGGECIMERSETAREAWQYWMNSPGHRSILLGLDLDSSDTTTKFEYGIGHAYVPGSERVHYWVAIIASRKERSTISTSSTECSGKATSYSHVIRGEDGKLKPSCGYVWVNAEPTDLRVKLMPGLMRTGDGNLLPASGYRWVRRNDPEDLRVEPIS